MSNKGNGGKNFKEGNKSKEPDYHVSLHPLPQNVSASITSYESSSINYSSTMRSHAVHKSTGHVALGFWGIKL